MVSAFIVAFKIIFMGMQKLTLYVDADSVFLQSSISVRWLGLSICVDSFGWSAVGLCCDPSCCAGDFLLLEAEQFCHSQRVQSVSHHSQLVPGVVPVN